MKKQVDVVMLPTEKVSKIIRCHNNKLWYNDTKWLNTYQHLYLLSDDEIKEGDWIFVFGVIIKVLMCNNEILFFDNGTKTQRIECKKIIATTDESLRKPSGEMYPEWDYLPRPSNEFLKKYCELGGIDKVLVEYELDSFKFMSTLCTTKQEEYKLKVTLDNTITIYPI